MLLGSILSMISCVYVDPMDVQYNGAQSTAEFTYIKRPAKFAIGPGPVSYTHLVRKEWR